MMERMGGGGLYMGVIFLESLRSVLLFLPQGSCGVTALDRNF